jgi:tyrosine ammonia-lyase
MIFTASPTEAPGTVRHGTTCSAVSVRPAAVPPRPSVDLGGDVAPADVHAIAHGRAHAIVGAEARVRMGRSSAYLAQCVEERRVIYGVTTGYGPLARHLVGPEHAATLQRNLIYHLAAGVGPALPDVQVRALMVARIASLARGLSGVDDRVVDLLLACLARGVTPVVPEKGTVGASGDLTPLAHIALVLIGEGRARHGGREMPGGDALREAGLTPLSLGHKEGLALVNGTSAMTGIAALNAERARRAAALMARLAVLHAEVLGGRVEAWDARFGRARPHPGQRLAHETLMRHAAGSRRLLPSEQPPPRLDERMGAHGLFSASEPHQDPYTTRCVPQELGAALDVIAFHERVVETELNAATDNPLVFAPDERTGEPGAVLHGGNFYGQHVAFASDALATAVIKLGAWSERALARLVHPTYNGGLPAFLHGGAPGLNSGFMGAQVTATALVAEMRTLAIPASVQTIPTNNDNQDVVTMGTIGARRVSSLLDMAWHVLGIQALALAQAAELRADAEGRESPARAGFGSASVALIDAVRGVAAPLDDDRPLAWDIAAVTDAMESSPLLV